MEKVASLPWGADACAQATDNMTSKIQLVEKKKERLSVEPTISNLNAMEFPRRKNYLASLLVQNW